MLFGLYKSVSFCNVWHVRDIATGEPKTYALVDLSSADDAEQAIKQLNDSMHGGRRLVVQMGG